jgi:isopentenyl-diphosphate delta-isomerase
MAEMLETFDAAGRPAGLVARADVHERGLWHKAAQVFLFRSDGRLIVQRRGATKDVCPDTWDLSVAEHLAPGEDYLAGAERGLREELGLTGVSLERATGTLCSRLEIPELRLKDFELQQCFKGISDRPLFPDAREVAEVRCYRLDELRVSMKNSPARFTPWFRDRAQDVLLFA